MSSWLHKVPKPVVAFFALLFATHLFATEAKRLFSFGGDAGVFPTEGMTAWQGKLYGTTDYGAQYDHGVVFELNQSNGAFEYRVIYVFQDDDGPGGAPVTFDRHGNLYTYTYGGRYDEGTVIRLTPQDGMWKRTILYTFTGTLDGSVPVGKLIFDPQGNLYGTTVYGGTMGGVVFQLAQSGEGWHESVIHNLDSFQPHGVVLADDGSLLGFTRGDIPPLSGPGTLYKLKKEGDAWIFTVVHNFNAPHGSSYIQGRPVLDGLGNVYGSGFNGGTYDKGTLFKVSLATGEETIIHSFSGGTEDGENPIGNLYLDKQGTIWGATVIGGLGNGGQGNGTVFKYVPSTDTYELIYDFVPQVGAAPNGSLIQDGHGNLYGTAGYGGDLNWGTIFQVKP